MGKPLSVRERRQSENTEPRVLRTTIWCRQLSQRPAFVSAATADRIVRNLNFRPHR